MSDILNNISSLTDEKRKSFIPRCREVAQGVLSEFSFRGLEQSPGAFVRIQESLIENLDSYTGFFIEQTDSVIKVFHQEIGIASEGDIKALFLDDFEGTIS